MYVQQPAVLVRVTEENGKSTSGVAHARCLVGDKQIQANSRTTKANVIARAKGE